MKILFALPLLLLGACQPAANTATECAVPFEKTKLLVGDQVRHYVLVPHFKPQRKACWTQLRGYLQSADAPLGTEAGAHLFVYLDTTDFALPAGGSAGRGGPRPGHCAAAVPERRGPQRVYGGPQRHGPLPPATLKIRALPPPR